MRLMFLTRAGAVPGSAEMLKPVTGVCSHFDFFSLDESSMRRLKCAIQPHAPANEIPMNGSGNTALHFRIVIDHEHESCAR